MRPPALRISHDELIVDNFAGGGGASLGIEWALGRSPDIAINHDPEAIAMHKANHPATRHYCEDVWNVDPAEACKGRPVGLAWFSPDCKHFSKAKGGKPVDKKIRALAWIVIRWAKAVKPRVICLENVEEFEDWGPLLEDGRPCPARIGLTFRIWVGKLKALGYKVEWRELLGADYGAPTLRNRLFLTARRDGLPIVWPAATFGPTKRQAWRVAAECIDFSLPTYSIFLTREEARQYGVKRPLAENTMRRVFRGFDKFVARNPRPYIVGLAHGEFSERAGTRSHGLDEPIRTIHAGGNNHALVTPFLTEHANGSRQRTFDIDQPLRTQCAQVKGGHFALVAPYLAGAGGPEYSGKPVSTERPFGALLAENHRALIAPYMVPRYGERDGQEPRALTVDRPMPTIVPTQNGAQLVAAFLAKHYGGHETPGSDVTKPIDTVTAKDHNALVASSLVKLKGTCAGGQHYAETRAFLLKYYGSDQDPRLEEPLHTLTGKDRFALVTVHGEPYVVADIGMRMLAPRELYRAQGFPDSYLINIEHEGRPFPKDAQVRMVGNSVCPPVAAALARAQFEDQVVEVVA